MNDTQTATQKNTVLEELWQELKAIHHTMNIARTWRGNKNAEINLDIREVAICRAINKLRSTQC